MTGVVHGPIALVMCFSPAFLLSLLRESHNKLAIPQTNFISKSLLSTSLIAISPLVNMLKTYLNQLAV